MSKAICWRNLIVVLTLISLYTSFNIQIDHENLSDLTNLDKMIKHAVANKREPENPFANLNHLAQKMIGKNIFSEELLILR
jgi:hypothetical protein